MNKFNEANPQTDNAGQTHDLGRQLRRARETNGLSIQSVSASLHLTPKIVISLEEGDLAQFQPVYVKGYLRNYGRLLNLPIEPLMKSYERIIQATQPALKMPQQSTKKTKINWVLVLLLAAIVLTTLGWIASKVIFPITEAPTLQSEADASHLPLSSTHSEDGSTIENASKPLEELPDSEGTTQQSGKLGDQPSAERNDYKPMPSETDLTNQFVGPPKPEFGGTQHGKPTSSNQTVGLENPAKANPPDNQGVDTIAVHLSARAWVGIRDHTGRRLVYKRLPAGTDISLSGQAPFLVVLGNTSATKIQFNGKPYPLPNSKAGATARLTVGQNEAQGE